MIVANPGENQGGGDFALKAQLFAQLLGHNIDATFFDFERADISIAQGGLQFFAVEGHLVENSETAHQR